MNIIELLNFGISHQGAMCMIFSNCKKSTDLNVTYSLFIYIQNVL